MKSTILPLRLAFFNTPEGGDGSGGSGAGGGKPPEGQQPKPGEKPAEAGKPDDGKGGKEAILADLAKERDKRQAMEQQLAELTKAQEAQRDAFAKALGLKPEENSDADKITEQLKSLTDQFGQAQRKATLLEVAAAPGEDAEGNPLPAIPKEYHHLLTASETEALQEQARSIAQLIVAKSGMDGTPNFQASNGQGHSGTSGKQLTQEDLKGMSPEAVVKAKQDGLLDHLMGVQK